MQLRPDRTYVSHEVREHPPRLHICCATQPSHYPAYSSLLNIIFDHNFERAFTLVYSFMLVEVTGNHLGAVVHAINYGNCERIIEFHRKLHDLRPGSAGSRRHQNHRSRGRDTAGVNVAICQGTFAARHSSPEVFNLTICTDITRRTTNMKKDTEPHYWPTWKLTPDEAKSFYRGSGPVTAAVDDNNALLSVVYHSRCENREALQSAIARMQSQFPKAVTLDRQHARSLLLRGLTRRRLAAVVGVRTPACVPGTHTPWRNMAPGIDAESAKRLWPGPKEGTRPERKERDLDIDR